MWLTFISLALTWRQMNYLWVLLLLVKQINFFCWLSHNKFIRQCVSAVFLGSSIPVWHDYVPLIDRCRLYLLVPVQCLSMETCFHIPYWRADVWACALLLFLNSNVTSDKLGLIYHKFKANRWLEKPETSGAQWTWLY